MTSATTPLRDRNPGSAEDGLAAFLTQIAAVPLCHARFLNTLSLLEYVGARKIYKSQPATGFTVELLEHVVEEGRHALVLKKLALRLGGDAVRTYDAAAILCGGEATRYMQTLDRGAEADLASSGFPAGENRTWINYLLTTLLIEERADAVYPIYEPVLTALGHGGVAAAIVAEEKRHLRAVFDALAVNDPNRQERLERLRPLERQAFTTLLSAWTKEVEHLSQSY
jgi:hypothetical protein